MKESKDEEKSAPAKLSICNWAEEDRPREKLIRLDAASLSDAELLAILIGSGSDKESAVELMKRILHDCDNSLAMLSKRTVKELMEYHGIGEAKAVSIIAACELGRRRERSEMPRRKKMNDPRAIYEHLATHMRDLDVEEAYVLLLNQNLLLIDTKRLSHGGLTETAVDVRLIMKDALLANATAIALAHNHPSGNKMPSRNDDSLTEMVKRACQTMRITFIDHVIVTDGDYYSYKENNKL